MHPVNWFEIPVTNMERAKVFYEYVFGIPLETHEVGDSLMSWFPMEEKAPGAAGSLVRADQYVPSHRGILIYFSVEDIDGALRKVVEKKGKILNPKTSIGEYGFIAYFEDTEGNRIGLHSMN